MIVSGQITFDAFGRTIAQRYPTTESKAANGSFNPVADTVTATTMAYDVLDRNTRTTIPDASFTTISYGFGPDRAGVTQFETVVTDANLKVKRTYRDVRELITSVKEFNQGTTIWTSYAYDALKQINAHTQPQSAPVYCVAWSPDFKQIASGSLDKSIKIWDATSGALVKEIKGYDEKTSQFLRQSIVTRELAFFISSLRQSRRNLDPIGGNALLFQHLRCQLVEVQISLFRFGPAANQTIIGQDYERRAPFAIKLGGPCRPLDVSG